MLVTLVPAPFDDLACVGLVLLHGGVRQKSDVVMHVEVEQRPGFASGLVHEEIVERVVL